MKTATDYSLNYFNGGKNEIFVTFTYENPMNDMEQLKKDFDYFWKRLKMQMQDLEYLWIVNPFLYNFYKDTFLYSTGVK